MGDAIGGASLAVGVGTLAKSADAAKDSFAGASCTEKVLSQMGHGDFHAFPESVKAFQEAGIVKKIIGADGAAGEMLSIPGGYKGWGGGHSISLKKATVPSIIVNLNQAGESWRVLGANECIGYCRREFN
jgi:hypothetical protein